MTDRAHIPSLDDNKTVPLEIESLITGKVLVQAMSGGGKSYAVRRILEQIHGLAQQIVIDPEGEYHTLRELYDHVLIGPGGEGPATIESAAKMATRLLELGVSAIIDISDLGTARAEYVKRFLGSIMDAPRELWHPLVLTIDEAQKFCPEKGAGEAVSSEAVKDYATRGRKRGFSLIVATQRIAELHKTVGAECQHKLIGRTCLDVDIDRARRPLGMSASHADNFLPQLNAGVFYVAGFGLAGKPRPVWIGGVKTTHPKAGMGSMPVTPPRNKVKAILAQFSDIPKEAAAEARTVDQLKARVRELEQDIAPLHSVDLGAVSALTAERDELRRKLEDSERMVKLQGDTFEKLTARLDRLTDDLVEIRNTYVNTLEDEVETESDSLPEALDRQMDVPGTGGHTQRLPRGVAMSAMERAFLVVLAQRGFRQDTKAKVPIQRSKILLWSNYARSGTSGKAFASLVTKSWAEPHGGSSLSITPAGLLALGPFEKLPTGRALREQISRSLDAMARAFFEKICNAWPNAIDRKAVLEGTGYARSGTSGRAFAYLVAREYVIATGKGALRAAEELF